jgi:hypothetical protein
LEIAVNLSRSAARARLDTLARACCPIYGRAEYWRLVQVVRIGSMLLGGTSTLGEQQTILHAFARLVRHHRDWRQVPESWSAPAASPRVQLRSLMLHLFGGYPLPATVADTWLRPTSPLWERELYLHLAAGLSVRRFKFPCGTRLSKRAAAWFMQAPDDLSIQAALRWAQVRALDGDERLARALATETLLGAIATDHEFWATVTQFLVRHQPISVTEMREIIAFIQRQRFLPASAVIGGAGGNQPLQPALCLRRMSLRSLRRMMANWQPPVAPTIAVTSRVKSPLYWSPSDIGYYRTFSNGAAWAIHELLSDVQLRIEGKLMRHCVASYAGRCARRESSIWSLTSTRGGKTLRELTIEVQPAARTIVQFKGRHNAAPSAVQLEVVLAWAELEGLRLP